jgi:putative membrane protein
LGTFGRGVAVFGSFIVGLKSEVRNMMYGNYDWGWMAFMPLLWAVLIGVVVWAILRLTQQDRAAGMLARGHRESAREALDRRFASGEIDDKTYDRMRSKLSS